ncbi:Copper-sensing transcriptional repressor RicR [Phycisphaerales bacterium]|nr:Copper-sensing transcriptional repressor RicR [Phycisphaerales bacterium]
MGKSTKSGAPSRVEAAACACDSGGNIAADGRRALGVDAGLKSANITRLKRAEGQVRGIARMIEQDRYCPDVIVQIAAAQESLRAVAKNLLKNHLKHCARAAMKAGEAEADAMCDELTDVLSRLTR